MNDLEKAIYYLDEMNYQNTLIETLEKNVKENGKRSFTFSIEINLEELEDIV